MKCLQCGRESAPGARFCSNCGAPLGGPSTDTTTVLRAITDEHVPELTPEDIEAVTGLAPDTALLIINPGGSESERILINSDITTVGRHPDSDIFLDNITVSRNHARFVREGTTFFLEDLGSLNGTYVNRRIVESRVRLAQGDEIQIGRYRATISMGEPGPN